MVTTITIDGHIVGKDQPCFIIAEAGVNHNGDIDTAKSLVKVASEAGADAIKFQTFTADALVTPSAPKAEYQKQSLLDEESHFEMIRRLEMSREMHSILIEESKNEGITFLSSPFDEESADLLESLNICGFKIPSGEITNLGLLEHIAKKNKPMIVSTGMSTLSEVSIAVQAIERTQNHNFILLHCVSNYPADPSDINLLAMESMSKAFNVPIGYSDHTLGLEISLAAVAMGACVIEKHFTIDRRMEGPDHAASLEPTELAQLVNGIRNIESAIGDGKKQPVYNEIAIAAIARKSLVAKIDIPTGTMITKEMLLTKRPGTGIPPTMAQVLIGRTARHNVSSGELLTFEMFN